MPEGIALEILRLGCGIGCSTLVALHVHVSEPPCVLFASALLHEYPAPGGDGDRPVNQSYFSRYFLGLLRLVHGD